MGDYIYQEYPKAIEGFLVRDAGEEAALREALTPTPVEEPPVVDDTAIAFPQRRVKRGRD